MREITRRDFLGKTTFGGLILTALGCGTDKEKIITISPEALKAISSEFPDFARMESGDNKYKTRMLYSDQSFICLRISESEVRQLIKGEMAEWGSEDRFFFERKDSDKVFSYDFYGEIGSVPGLKSFPVFSPNGERSLQVLRGGIYCDFWRGGKLSYSASSTTGLNPRWFDDNLVWRISHEGSIVLSHFKKFSSEFFKLDCSCRGFDISSDKKEMVYVETCPTKLGRRTGIAGGHTKLCHVNLETLDIISGYIRLRDSRLKPEDANIIGKIQEHYRRVRGLKKKVDSDLDVQVNELALKESSFRDIRLREFFCPRISPDGKKVGFIEAYGPNLYKMDVLVYVKGEQEPRTIKSDLKRDLSLPFERILAWANSDNLAVNEAENRITVFNLNGKYHSFPGKNISVYHAQENV